MKNKHVLVFICSIVVFSANALLQKSEKFQDKNIIVAVGVFDGYDAEDGYSFLIRDANNDDEETIYFTEMTPEALKTINLKSNDLIGKRFEVTYEVTEYEEEDDEGNSETFERYTIIKIKKL